MANSQVKLNDLMNTYRDYKRNINLLLAAVGEGEFTRKQYNTAMPTPFFRRSPSPCLETLLTKGIVKVVRTEEFTIEKETDDENFQFELPNGDVLSEEDFCKIPFEDRLKMPVRVIAAKGKTIITGKRNYYQIVKQDKDTVREECLKAVLAFFEE